jgi:signal transduction histidine kinase
VFQGDLASGWGVGVLTGSAIATGTRVRFPLLALLAQLGVTLLAATLAEGYISMSLALAVMCLISVGIERPIRIVIPAIVMVQAVFLSMTVLPNDESFDGDISVFGVICGTAGAAGIGIAIRSQRQYIEAIRERALHAEETREAESRRRVSEERMRIARDLHDAVAHHIAVVSVYTGLARTTLTTSVEQSEAALARAQEATRSVLTEMQQIVHILRASESGSAESRQPAPDFRSIEEMVASFKETGIEVDFLVLGRPGTMSTATGLVAYRVIQEALTNAHRHGDGRARAVVTFGDHDINIEVTNRLPAPDSIPVPDEPGTGTGLIGMQERVRLVNGSMQHSLVAGRFTLRVELPWSPFGPKPGDPHNGVAQDEQDDQRRRR